MHVLENTNIHIFNRNTAHAHQRLLWQAVMSQTRTPRLKYLDSDTDTFHLKQYIYIIA